ncbi:rod shape-determining protein MreD [Alkaliphilus peptidifermentans]|uniref:Rod shape-determining protein MreD n=1 Tax=Alkaliphilus peptidifermentans DSM 18978 TaxID=1120976 RepID=A0A1G5DN19_9FIRM|nr:rod shape-determining protein MreD [Alkaliphilus peptidifermentans]SCY15820.1 rod shape-determining protein MreD [Alkaliphilus peptidifermentans DSM 18978]
MKALIIGVIIVINLIFQSTLLQYFKIYDVLPNTALILVISLAIYSGKNKGAIIGFFVGILQDIIFGRIIGLNAMIFMVTGYTVGSINRNLFKDNLIVPFTLTALATGFYEVINMLLIFLLGYRIELFNVFKKMLFIGVLYNSIFSVIIYIYVSKLFRSRVMKKRY